MSLILHQADNVPYLSEAASPSLLEPSAILAAATDKNSLTPYVATATVILPDFTSWNDPTGIYSIFMAPFNSGALRPGGMFSQQARLEKSRFPNSATLSWSWPSNYLCPNGVWGYNHLAYGTYLGGDPTPVVPKKINQIMSLSQRHDISILGSDATSQFDVLIDIFFTNVSGAGSMPASALTAEVGVFLHTPPTLYNFAQGQPSKGSLNFAGKIWNVNVAPDNAQGTPYVMLQPIDQSDVLSATIDLKQVFLGLVSLGVLTGEEWFNGIGFGVEPMQGAGAMAVNSYSVIYK